MGYGDLFEKKITENDEFIYKIEAEIRKKTSVPIERNLRLSQALNLLTKKELDDMRVRLKMDRVSNLSKYQLADALTFNIRRNLSDVLINIGVDEFNLLVHIMKSGGYISFDEKASGAVLGLIDWGILFIGMIENEAICVIPVEIRNDINHILRDDAFIEERRKRWLWTKVIEGLLYYYGVLEALDLNYFVEMATGKSTSMDFFRFVFNNTGKGKRTENKGGLFYDYRVVDPIGLYKPQEKNKDIKFKSFTQEDLLKAVEEDFSVWNDYDKRFQDYLISRFGIEEKRSFYIVQDARFMFMNGFDNCTEEYVERYFRNLDNKTRDEILNMLGDIQNNTHRWALKGYTPLEIKNKKGNAGKQSDIIYQIRVDIKGIKPPIWRKLQVTADTTFEELHRIIQRSFKFDESHPYEFEVFGKKVLRDTKDKLRQFDLKEKDKLSYKCDLRDRWEYSIVIEKILERIDRRRYPLCVGGKRNAPPTDVGGVKGYYELLSALQNPKDVNNNMYLNFFIALGYDPEKFEQEEITLNIRKS